MSKYVVQTHSLSKKHGDTFNVNNIDLKVNEGEIYGFLGPNGAGKTTTIKMLLGLVKPTNGDIKIFGQDLKTNRLNILKQIGSLVESPSYYGHLTGYENLEIIRRMLNVPRKNIDEVLEIVRLQNQKEKLVKNYSLGMKQRLGIASSLLAFPKLLILDEPTNGLDPSGIHEIRELIKELPSKYGMTVIISSHLLSEIDHIATQVGIIQNGVLIFQDDIAKLRQQSNSIIRMKVNNLSDAHKILLKNEILSKIDGDSLVLNTYTEEQIAQANRLMINNNMSVYRIEEEKRTLEDIFLELTAKGGSL
ncbi:ABC transporter ATP-binding protein [Bacillus cereus]|uniref:ABC transporter ATP-binding protein n=1 Tax=Bacillus cereus TaxID=1396 RepID=UPI000BF502C3|nr:ABC transporter ATP-binding protein [Bacillus cereus]PES12351.1 bacitracin ABC transporter ATP-binding protein [Bacillus cereus]PEX16950.1 bacitracin ABC transporter ATP-binding protein [Bacillus cereus]PFC35611.1 bacitracin ABC transporter ATP-binding protein [Bacillus cereus]PFQ72077.1 bacitracin ABC transporter ATP-binding protein [Bacillus cereus]PFU10140.1 bacitracin ABC transporter ATP-binding protein [Bacillus cereus]